VAVRAIRGAIQVDADDREAILEGASELVRAALERNNLSFDDLISVVFTATPDLTAEFPAYAARLLGMHDVPLLCATEIAVPGAMPRVVRLLAHVETPLPRAQLRHPYLRGAAALRRDLPKD
jgi:chorismate mutase